jgi:hypothetical protein
VVVGEEARVEVTMKVLRGREVLQWLAVVVAVEVVVGWMNLVQTLTWKMRPQHWMRMAMGFLALHVNQ